MKKNDLMLVGIIVAVAVAIFGMRFAMKEQGQAYVTIRIDGEVDETYPLSEDHEITIGDNGNVVMIKNGQVDMIDADCPDRLCVNQKPISRNGESIICLPNEVIVQITSQDEAVFDAFTN